MALSGVGHLSWAWILTGKSHRRLSGHYAGLKPAQASGGSVAVFKGRTAILPLSQHSLLYHLLAALLVPWEVFIYPSPQDHSFRL